VLLPYYEVCNGLYYKATKRQLERFKAFTSFCVVLPLSESVADLAAQIFGDFRSKGITIGHTDILIASTAIHYDIQLITNNTKHFKDIPQLRLDNWLIE
jgi:predicted nucleic acid-binding protein